ncbi:MAG: homoprotocatechuate degradation operon regulator HpaR, partial [Pigmentiphaga sp.]
RMLAGMEAGGLIRRERLDADQRRQEISLTRKSETLIARMRPAVDEKYRQLEATIGRDLLERLYRDLDQATELVRHVPK